MNKRFVGKKNSLDSIYFILKERVDNKVLQIKQGNMVR